MMGFFEDVDPQVAPIVIGSMMGALVIQCVCLVLAIRKRGRFLELAALVGWALPLFAAVVAWRNVVERIVEAIHATDPAMKSTAIARAASTQLNVATLLCFAMLPLTAIATSTLSISARRRTGTALAAYAVIAAGGAAVLFFAGGIGYAAKVVSCLGVVATSEPASKADLLRQGLQDSLAPLHSSAIAACIVAAVAVCLGVAAALRSPEPASMPMPMPMNTSAISAVIFGLGALLLLEVLPFLRENHAPDLPYSSAGSMIEAVPGVRAPEVSGPDPIERAPTISIATERMMIEGVAVDDAGALGERLSEMRKVDQLMKPDRAFAGALNWIVDAQVTGDVLVRALEAGRSSGYVRGTFAFVRDGTIERPLLGTLRLSGASGARFDLQDGEERVELEAGERFAKIAERVVAARAKQKTVLLVLQR